MASPNGNDNGDAPFHPAVNLPARLPENPRQYDQLFRFQGSSSVDFTPSDVETLESGMFRLGLGDSERQNRRWTVYDDGLDNWYPTHNDMMNNRRIHGHGIWDSASETELGRIDHSQQLILPNNYPNVSFGVSNSSRNVPSSSRTQNPPFDSVRLENLRGRILPLSKNRYYSQLLRRIMDEDDSGDKIEVIFEEVIQFLDELMMDSYGHHVFQELVEKCSDLQIAQIIDMLARNPYVLLKICTDSVGTRAVQTLLKSLRSQELVSMITRSLSTIAVSLSMSNNGQHVIHCCLKHFSAEDNMFLMIKLVLKCYQIATDQHGCCLLQQCISYCIRQQSHCLAGITRYLVNNLAFNALRLAQHRYGNYIVQYLLEQRDPQITAALLRRLEGNYGSLSRDKYGSHVVQKCLTDSGDQHSERIICELIGDFGILVLDPFGNYVLQSALMVSKEQNDMRYVLMNCVRENLPLMLSNKYGKKVIEKLKQM